LRLVFMGSPGFAIPPLQLLILNGHRIAAVYTRPDKPAGRGLAPVAPPIKNAALSGNLAVIQVPNLKNPEAIEQLKQFRPEVIVVAAFGQILPQAVLDIPCYGCLNIHPSLLPKYRGASPVPSAILAGDEFIGVSVMRLDVGMDTGPVFSQAQIPVLPGDTTESLIPKLFQIGGRMLLGVLADLPWNRVLPEPQNNVEATYTREITKEDGLIDWNLPAEDIWRRVRAYQSWPEAYTHWQGKQLKIIEAVPLSADSAPEIGRVVALPPLQNRNRPPLGVGTGRGVLGILKVQFEGKRAMSGEEFLRGQRAFPGAVLG
jgi:methionyl-tRNA formyltransferase